MAGGHRPPEGGRRSQGGDRWVKLHEESLEFHPRFFAAFEEKREN